MTGPSQLSSPHFVHAGNQDALTPTLSSPFPFPLSNAEGVHASIPSMSWTDHSYENDHEHHSFLPTVQNDFVFTQNGSANPTLNLMTEPDTILPPPPPPSTTPTANPPVQHTCGIASTQACTLSLSGNLQSIRFHLGLHGHRHHAGSVVSCPWAGCVRTMRWMNIPRHIRSCHLGVKFQCENCDKHFTREYGLARHVQANQCAGAN